MHGTRKRIVLSAFHKNMDGTLSEAFEPREMKSEEMAIYVAQTLTRDYAGVVLLRREADTSVGGDVAPVILYQYGHIPEFEQDGLASMKPA